jgi:hypothetical protein
MKDIRQLHVEEEEKKKSNVHNMRVYLLRSKTNSAKVKNLRPYRF